MPPIINTKALADAMPRSSRRRLAEREGDSPRIQVPQSRSSAARSPALPEFEKTTTTAVAGTGERRGYDAAAVDNRENPITSLTPYIEGYEAWTVDAYYGQVLGADENTKPFSLDMSPSLQQYLKISDLELKVTDPLSYEYDNARQEEKFTGRAIMQGNTIVPNKHDVFVVSVGRGMKMIFAVTSVTPMSAMQETVYEIGYYSTDQYTQHNAPYLENKVTSTLTYSRELLLQGRRALINTQQASTLKELKEHGNKLIRMYIEDFATGNKHRYLAIPDQNSVVLDVYLQDTWYDLLDVTDYPELKRLNWIHMNNIPEVSVPTLWDALMRKNDIKTKGVKYRMTKELWVVETADFILSQNNPMLGGVYYTGLDAIIAPKLCNARPKSMRELCPSIARIDVLDELLNPGTKLEPKDLTDRLKGPTLDIYPIQYDSHYVLSRHFYDEDVENQSVLELLVGDYLSDKAIDSGVLARLCEKAYNWGSLERYYYTIILLILIEQRLHTN